MAPLGRVLPQDAWIETGVEMSYEIDADGRVLPQDAWIETSDGDWEDWGALSRPPAGRVD